MKKLIVCFFIIISIVTSQSAEAKTVLNPYQDYLIIMIHGLNDYKNSFLGTNEEWSSDKRNRLNLYDYLTKNGVGIDLGNVQAYSFTNNRGSVIQNAYELGKPGIRITTQSEWGRGEKRPEDVNMGLIQNLGDSVMRQIVGTALPYVAPNKDHKSRPEYWSYVPSLDKWFATGVEPGNSFLEQARKDFKEWWFDSENNRDPQDKNKKLYSTIEKVPDSLVPKKYIFITHSMGNMAARLYIYSDELAKKGEIFKEGFYGKDVAKAVFVAPPLEGSDVAFAGVLSPAFKLKSGGEKLVELMGSLSGFDQAWNSQMGKVTKSLDSLINELKDPFLQVKNPRWGYTGGNQFVGIVMEQKDLIDSKAYVENMLGIRGEARIWNQAVLDLMPDSLDTGLGHIPIRSPVVTALKSVRKENEPLYGIVYGRGVGGLSIPNTLLKVGEGLVGGALSKGFDHVRWECLMDDFWKLPSETGRYMALLNGDTKSPVVFTSDGDFAVPVWSAEARNTVHLKDARRYSKMFSGDTFEDYLGTVQTKMAAAELAWMTAMIFVHEPDAQDWIRVGCRIAVISDVAVNAMLHMDDLQRFMLSHQEMYGAREEILKALMEQPEIALKDSEYIANQGLNWSGLYGVTINETVSTEGTKGLNKLNPIKITDMDNKAVIVARIPTFNGVEGGNGLVIDDTTSTNSIEKKFQTIVLKESGLYVRGIVRDLSPKKMPQIEYSLNFSGWASFKGKVQNDGRFELGPFTLSEGQNLIAFRTTNLAGFSNNQVLKILKTGISLQPVLDETYPQPDSILNTQSLTIKLAYQNMKYSDVAGNAMKADSFTLERETGPPGEVAFNQAQVQRDRLNRLEINYPTKNLQDGKYNVTVKAHDAYNTSSFFRFSFTIDTQAPTITLSPIKPYSPLSNDPLKLNFSVTDNVSAFIKSASIKLTKPGFFGDQTIYEKVYADKAGGSWEEVVSVNPTVFPDGKVTLTIKAKDEAGNERELKKEIVIDRTPPKLLSFAADKKGYGKNQPASLTFKSDEPVQGILTVKNLDKGVVETRLVTANAEKSIDLDLDNTGYEDGHYRVDLHLKDEAGNGMQTVTGNACMFKLKKTAPKMGYFTVSPLILSGEKGYEAEVQAVCEDGGQAQLVITNQRGETIGVSTVNIEAKQLCRYPISGKDWAKGGYHAELVLTDEMGNVNSQGMDFSKEGTLPQILLPKEGEMIGGVQAIKGVVMDPDLTNGRPLSRFRFLLKKGIWTLRTASDLTGFEANDAISVPQRYRKSTGLNETEGDVEVRISDTLAYFNTALLEDGEYTLALVVEESGLGITGITSTTVMVSHALGIASEGTDKLGKLKMEALPQKVNFCAEGLPINAVLMGGSGTVSLEVMDKKTGKVVFNQQVKNLRSPTYFGKPGSFPEGVTIYSETAGEYRCVVKSTPPKNNHLLITGMDGDVILYNNGAPYSKPGTRMLNLVATEASQEFMFKASGKLTLFLTVDDEVKALSPDIYLGNTLSQAQTNPVMIEPGIFPEIAFKWMGTWGAGRVNSGAYEIKMTIEGVDGIGLKTVTQDIAVTTVYEAEAQIQNTQIDPYTSDEPVALDVRANKPSVVTADLYNQTGQKLKTIANMRIDSTESGHFYRLVWDGSVENVIQPEGRYRINVKITPGDSSPSYVKDIQVTLKSKPGQTLVPGSRYFKELGTTENVGAELRDEVEAVPGFFWQAKATGWYYPPIKIYHTVDLVGAKQQVKGYPWVPFVTVAHRWYDTVNIKVNYQITGNLQKHGFKWDVVNGHWDAFDDSFSHAEKDAFAIHNDDPYESVIEFNLNDTQDSGWPGKPDTDVSTMNVHVWVKTPDGKVIEEMDLPLVKGEDQALPSYRAGQKGAFSGTGYYWNAEHWADGNSRLVKIKARIRLKLEEKMAYSRLTNRFYPILGWTNKNHPRQIDCRALFEDESALNFPMTGFFELTPAAYRQALALVPHSTEVGVKRFEEVDSLINQTQAFKANKASFKAAGSSHTTYLSGEHFELIVVNASPVKISKTSSPNWYWVEPAPAALSGTVKPPQYTVGSTRELNLIIPWEKQGALEALDGYRSVWQAKEQKKQVYSEDWAAAVVQGQRLNPFRIDYIDFSQSQSGYNENLYVEVDDNTMSSDTGRTWSFESKVDRIPGISSYSLVTKSQLDAKLRTLPKNIDLSSVTFRVNPAYGVEPSKLDGKITLTYGEDINAQVPESQWQEAWSSDQFRGQVKPYMPPVFNMAQGSADKSGTLKIPFFSGYQGTLPAGVEITGWTDLSLLDDRLQPHPDLTGKVSKGYAFDQDQLEVSLKAGNRKEATVLIKSKIALKPEAYSLSFKRDGVWEAIEKPSAALQAQYPDVIGFWKVSRLNGRYTLKLETGGQTALKDVWVGSKVDTQLPKTVVSPYGRVQLIFPEKSYAQDTLVTVTPVSLGEVAVTNMPEIANLDFMPIVEIAPSSNFKANNLKPTLVYQYSQPEVEAIEKGSYPGLAKPIQLDDVQIYHISKTGDLSLAKTIPASQRWKDLDHDGKLGSGGDVYRIVAEVDHFSTYAALEGLIPKQPSLNTVTKLANRNSVDLFGTIEVGVTVNGQVQPLGYELYWNNTPDFPQGSQALSLKEGDQVTHAVLSRGNTIQFKGIPLKEGENFFFLTYPKETLKLISRPYASVRVLKDTQVPTFMRIKLYDELQDVTPNQPLKKVFFSPNGDGRKDEVLFKITVSKPMEVQLLVMDEMGKQVAQVKSKAEASGQEINLSWNGCSNTDIPSHNVTPALKLVDGKYLGILTGMDEAGNVAPSITIPLILSTKKPKIEILYAPKGVSLKKRGMEDQKIRIRITDEEASPKVLTIKGKKIDKK